MIEELIAQKLELRRQIDEETPRKHGWVPRFDDMPIRILEQMNMLRESQIQLINKMISLINEIERRDKGND